MDTAEYNLSIKSKEEGSKFRIPTADEFIKEVKGTFPPLIPFVKENESEIKDHYQMFAAYFRKANGSTVDAAIYVAARITFEFGKKTKYSLSITHSRLKGLEQVRMSFGGTKPQKENENV